MTIAGRAIHEVTGLTVEAAKAFFASLAFEGTAAEIAEPIITQIGSRLDFLANVGLAYLTLDRAADSLSGGELQRIRLASSIGRGWLVSATCWTSHHRPAPADNERLIRALRDLEQQGNSVLVVEHDEAIMRAADHLIDLGPGAGVAGGRLVAQGTPAEVATNPQSVTGQFLSGVQRFPFRRGGRRISAGPSRWKGSRPTI